LLAYAGEREEKASPGKMSLWQLNAACIRADVLFLQF